MCEYVKLMINELNRLCDTYLIQQETFTEGEKIRETFRTLKDMGYSFVTPRIDPTSTEFDYLSVKGKQDYRKLVTIRKRRAEAQKLKMTETPAELRKIEQDLDDAIRKDYWSNNRKEYFRLINRITKEIVFNFYGNPYNECGELSKFFKII